MKVRSMFADITTRRAASLVLVAATALASGACRPDDEGTQMRAGALMLSDPSVAHPIAVSEEATGISVRITRNQDGLTPSQSAKVADFFSSYRRRGSASGPLVIEAPSGSANEVATMRAVSQMRYIAEATGLSPASVRFEAYSAGRNSDAPLKMSYMKAVAHGPDCGYWPDNLAHNRENVSYDNFGCAQQKNLAAMIANPADLSTPRGMTASPSERRSVAFEKYVTGESTVSNRSADERVSKDK